MYLAHWRNVPDRAAARSGSSPSSSGAISACVIRSCAACQITADTWAASSPTLACSISSRVCSMSNCSDASACVHERRVLAVLILDGAQHASESSVYGVERH